VNGRLGAVAGVLAVTLAGCSSSGGQRNAGNKVALDAKPVTVCAAAAKAVALPAGFPADFPLPPGTVVTSASDRASAGLVVTGVTSTSFKDVLAALQSQLPEHGFTAQDGETEPHDAESDWRSATFDGRWAIRELPQCPGDTSVSVLARPK
jgi:hypothetical protein